MQVSQSRPRTASQSPRTAPIVSGSAIIALALALITGFALGQLALLGGKPIHQASPRSAEASRTGMLFYEALDAYFITGQADQLRALIQPDFVDHVDGQSEAKGVDAFLRSLEELREVAGVEGLTVTQMPSSGNLVRFSVELPKATTEVLGALPVQTMAHTYSETLRIADGHVAERWSDLRSPVVVTTLTSFAWDPPPASQMLPAIERITMLRGSSMTLRFGAAHVVAVESGSLTIEGTPRGAASSLPEFPSDSTDLADAESLVALPGSTVFAGGNGPYRIVNEGPMVASALLFRIAGYAIRAERPELETFGTSLNDAGVQIETVSASMSLPNREGDWLIEIGWATLAAGTNIPKHEIAGSELFYVEQGALEADLGSCGQRCVQMTEGAGEIVGDQQSVQASEGISASNGALPAYRVSGDGAATLLIVTVSPAQE